jgi:hypothetical protein
MGPLDLRHRGLERLLAIHCCHLAHPGSRLGRFVQCGSYGGVADGLGDIDDARRVLRQFRPGQAACGREISVSTTVDPA